MGRTVRMGNPPIEISLRRSRRLRRMSLRVSRLDGRVTLSLPHRVGDVEWLNFLREREDWIRENLSEVGAPAAPAAGDEILFEGRLLPLVAQPGRAARLKDGTLAVPDAPERVGPAVKRFLQREARLRLAEATQTHAAALGARHGRITLRDTRSRWGSCTEEGNLMYSWRLVMAPPEVLDYVAAHEVAHLREMNHSRAFWRLVEGLCPEHRRHRLWLRENGADLHRLRLDG